MPWRRSLQRYQRGPLCANMTLSIKPGARLTKYPTIYHKITLSLLQDRLTTVTYNVLRFLSGISYGKLNAVSGELSDVYTVATMHRNLLKIRRVVRELYLPTDRHKNTQTHRHFHHNTPLPTELWTIGNESVPKIIITNTINLFF